LGVVLVFRDMSLERARETALRQRQKLEALGTLSAGVAHEINNPLNVIINYGSLISRRLDPGSSLFEHAQSIVEQSERIKAIVRNLLTFSRREKDPKSLSDLSDIVKTTLSMTQTVLNKDQIALSIQLPEALPKIMCRSQEIIQVLINLVNNARDALNERYPGRDENKTASIYAAVIEKQGKRWMRTTVEDRGLGISPDIVHRIFEPFFTTKTRDKGTGLGLYVSHNIVKDHSGELWLESAKGEYTRVHLDLPLNGE
jgi:signal transduction histidine kinase